MSTHRCAIALLLFVTAITLTAAAQEPATPTGSATAPSSSTIAQGASTIAAPLIYAALGAVPLALLTSIVTWRVTRRRWARQVATVETELERTKRALADAQRPQPPAAAVSSSGKEPSRTVANLVAVIGALASLAGMFTAGSALLRTGTESWAQVSQIDRLRQENEQAKALLGGRLDAWNELSAAQAAPTSGRPVTLNELDGSSFKTSGDAAFLFTGKQVARLEPVDGKLTIRIKSRRRVALLLLPLPDNQQAGEPATVTAAR